MRERERSKTLRCAIYTRKSSEEGLEQDFNSLHAQREACDAYILSQRHEGWKVLPALYDDGGYSGGTMERPALRRLLADIHDKKIDIVVVYKVDRLTRALTDFARIVEVFDAQGVSFVSVTQQFNTTSSMGRLTLNVLLSFAQFEREVTGERIRDKIAASKKKGMWMGGVVPLGYDAKDRTLVINDVEAEIVREIFKLYLELASVLKLERELARRAIRTKRFVTATGRVIGDKPFSRGHLYKLLANPLYLGEIQHHDLRHAGLHPAIMERSAWDAVQALLASNSRDRRHGTSAAHPSLLAGLLFGKNGNRYVSSHATKNGKRYRYYVYEGNAELRKRNEDGAVKRLAAGELEQAIVSSVVVALRDEHVLHRSLCSNHTNPDVIRTILAQAKRTALEIETGEPASARAALLGLIARIDIEGQKFRVCVNRKAFSCNFQSESEDLSEPGNVPLSIEGVVKAFRSNGKTTSVIATPKELAMPKGHMNLTCLKGFARGLGWFEELSSGLANSLSEIALREDVTDRYVARLVFDALNQVAR